jgi:hypothetical protein
VSIGTPSSSARFRFPSCCCSTHGFTLFIDKRARWGPERSMRYSRKTNQRGAVYAKIATDGDGIALLVELPFALTLGLDHRKKEACRRIQKALRGLPARLATQDGETHLMVRLEQTGKDVARRSAADIDETLASFAREKVTPNAVEQALGITSKERIRWTKDGRLPRSGNGTFKKGSHIFQYSLHPADKIAELAENPSIVASWRLDDHADATKI